MNGWSVTVGELRQALEGVPDDYAVVLSNAEVGDCEIAELYVRLQFPPALDCPGLVVLEQGQVITSEYEYYPRLDVGLEIGMLHWSTERGWQR